MNNYVCAFAGEVQGDGLTEAFGRAGNQSDLSTQLAIS